MSEAESGYYDDPEFIADAVTPKLLELGHVAMQFALVERGTGDLNGNPESDTDHSEMLGLMALALAEYDPRLDKGKIAKYALAHDLVEVYAGDNVTIHHERVDFADKQRREAAALTKLKAKFGAVFPEFVETIEAYEKLEDLESQFVKTLDKSMPAVTHIFNGCKTVLDEFDNIEQLEQNSIKHTAKLSETYGADHPLVIAVRQRISAQFRAEFAKRKPTHSVQPFQP